MVSMKKVLKVTGAACAATGVIALSGLVASGAAVGAVVEGFKSAAEMVKKTLSEGVRAEADAEMTEHPAAEEAAAESQEVLAD